MGANLYHDPIAGKTVTAILYMLNASPAHWHHKRQSTVETATFGSESVAARTAVDHIIDQSCILAYMSTPRFTCMEPTKQWSPMSLSLLPLSSKDPILLPTTVFEKQLQQAISSSIGRMQNPTLQRSLANIGDSSSSGLF